MKRFVFAAFSVLFSIVLLVPFVSFAHPGRTDSQGGHYNRSTGEYHYHHGYSPHDHYDMNNDGIVDCPYNFVDNTHEHSNAESHESDKETQNTNATVYKAAENEKEDTFIDKYGWIFALPFICWPILVVFSNKIEDMTYWAISRRKNRKVLKKLNAQKIKVPRNVVILEDGSVSLGKPSDYEPFGNYTVYVTENGKTFHKSKRCSRHGKPSHIFEISQSLVPCRRCAKYIKFPTSTPDWYEQLKKASTKQN